MFTRDSKILSHRLTTPLTSVSNAVGDVFKPITLNQIIKSLFANNEQGFVYDPNDLTTMFQDAAGTVPVTGVGQPVGLVLDKSGRGNHARQTTSASRPILRQNASTGANYLEFDGSDDFFVTNSIDFTGTDEVALITAFRTLGLSTGMLLELSELSINNGVFNISSLNTAVQSAYVSSARGTIGELLSAKSVAYPYHEPIVATRTMSISLGNPKLRINGVVNTGGAASNLGLGTFGNYPLYIGRRGGTTFPFNGHIYSLIGIGKLVSDGETITIEKELAKRVGVTLNV